MQVLFIFFVIIFSALAGAARAENFSQYEGFKTWYSDNPPTDTLPNAQDQALLKKHKPRFYLPPDHDGLISFYGDYIAGGRLLNGEGKEISRPITQEKLNTHKLDPEAQFIPARTGEASKTPTVFGRIDRVTTQWSGLDFKLTFLTYHAVFSRSGLPGGLLGWQKIALGLVGDLKDWHQLDHYTAATLILDHEDNPLALMLQQHNYLRTYVLGELIDLPQDGRPEVDVSVSSNELFPHRTGRVNRRAVSFPTPTHMRYLLAAGGRPLNVADDITHPVREQDYALAFIAPSDAFYTFQGYLGEKRLLPGRTASPGADYNTLPDLKPWDMQMLSGYWRDKNAGDSARLEKALSYEKYWLAFAQGQRDVFFANALCAQRWGKNCAFD
ncbi:MAG: hypothetical protein ACR2OJ_02075 [Hyphomicrobiales bacterium]